MQIYRGLDVGTAKPTPDEQARVVHHLLDIVDPSEEWSVAQFQAAARDAIAGIGARGRRALLVGGTGLYVRAVVDDLRFPGEDRALRARLELRAVEPGGLATLYEELVAADPDAATRIAPGNLRRIVRALEVIEITGAPFSATGAGLGYYGPTVFPVRMVGLAVPPAVLDARIGARVEAMYAAGLVAEVERLTSGDAAGLSRTAAQAIGYREALAVLDGSITEDDARAATIVRTRRFARRQLRWFRRDPRIDWLDAENPDRLATELLECLDP